MSTGDNLLDMQLQAKYQSPVRRTICPDCAFTLEDTDKGLHCKYCGWQENPTWKYIPKTPPITS